MSLIPATLFVCCLLRESSQSSHLGDVRRHSEVHVGQTLSKAVEMLRSIVPSWYRLSNYPHISKLRLTGPSVSEARLLWTEGGVFLRVRHDVICDDAFRHLACCLCELDGTVVYCFVAFSLIEDICELE